MGPFRLLSFGMAVSTVQAGRSRKKWANGHNNPLAENVQSKQNVCNARCDLAGRQSLSSKRNAHRINYSIILAQYVVSVNNKTQYIVYLIEGAEQI